MRLKQLEQNKIKREINMHGSTYEIYRTALDDYGESTDKQALVGEIRGLFHVSSGYETRNADDGTVTHSKAQPMLLCIFEESNNIQNGDYIKINRNDYKVVSKTNISEENILNDISLELMLNGNI